MTTLILTFFYIQTSLSALIAFLCLFRAHNEKVVIRTTGFLFAASFLFNTAQLIARTLKAGYLINTIGSSYEILSVIVAAFLFDKATNGKHRRFILALAVLFVIGAILNLSFFQARSMATINRFAANIVIIIYSVLYFYRLMVDLPSIYIHRIPVFWIASGFLLYAAGTIFLNAFMNYLINHKLDVFENYWVFNQSLLIIQQILVIIGVSFAIRSSSEKIQA